MLNVINQNLSWLEVGAMVVGGRPVRDAFLDARMVRLPVGTKLYKFNTYSSLQADEKTGNVTPWWSPYNAYDVDPGWQVKLSMARNLNLSIRELGRVTSAITETWNSLEYCVTIMLKVDMYVAYGRFKQQARHGVRTVEPKSIKRAPEGHVGYFQPERQGKTANLPGGGRQFFIPNLKPEYYGDRVSNISLLGL